MAHPTINSLNSCANCGAQTEYNFTSNLLKCSYCGSEFKLDEKPAKDVYKDEPTDNAGAVEFTRDIAEFKDKLLRWFTQGYQTPLNLLFDGTSEYLDRAYYPLYKFTGNYIGYFNTVTKSGRVLTQNNPLSGQFTVLCPSGEINKDTTELLDLKLIQNYNEKEIVPFNTIDSPAELFGGILDGSDVWDKNGNRAAAGFVYQMLAQNGTDQDTVYKHYLKYDLATVSKVYMPVFICIFTLLGVKSVVYMDDKTGTIIGEPLVDDGIKPPSKTRLFTKFSLIGFGAWFSILILRAFLAAFVDPHFKDENYSNNFLFSPPAEKFWLMRGSFFLLIMPFILSVVLYPLFVRRFFAKVQAIRNNSLDMVLTGKIQPRIFQ